MESTARDIGFLIFIPASIERERERESYMEVRPWPIAMHGANSADLSVM